MSRRGSARAVTVWLLAMAAMSTLALAEFIVSRAAVFVPAAAVAVAGAYLLGRGRQARAHVMSSSPGRDRRVVPGTVLSPGAVRLAQAEAENAELLERVRELSRQVQQLEDQAASHDDLMERLERVTRRPAELHIADLERAHGQYRRQP